MLCSIALIPHVQCTAYMYICVLLAHYEYMLGFLSLTNVLKVSETYESLLKESMSILCDDQPRPSRLWLKTANLCTYLLCKP